MSGEVSIRKSGSTNGSGPARTDRHALVDLKAQAVQMRLAGHRLIEIAAVVKRDVSVVSRWISGELEQRLDGAVTELRAVELERLDSYLVALEPGIERGDVKSVNAALRVSERRARLCGLDMPVKIESTVITVDMIDREMARLDAEMARLRAKAIEGTVPGEVLALEATDVDAVAWADAWEGEES